MGKTKIYISLTLYLLLYSSRISYSSSPLRDCIISTASSQVGTTEATGRNDGPAIKMYLASVGLREGHPYCAAFTYWNFKTCNIKLKIPNPAYSPNWFPQSRVIMEKQKGWDAVKPGDIFGLYFSTHKRIAHVGIVEKIKSTYIITLEANTSPSQSSGEADRNGDGVWRKRRMKRGVYKISNWL